jgi:hypothetical protein
MKKIAALWLPTFRFSRREKFCSPSWLKTWGKPEMADMAFFGGAK